MAIILTTVKVTTFKESGKYYDEFEITVSTEKDEWYYIIEAVRAFKTQGKPPQYQLNWLIGMENSREDMYPIIIKTI